MRGWNSPLSVGNLVAKATLTTKPPTSIGGGSSHKRETIHAVLTGIALDEMVERKELPEPLQNIVESDNGLYGIDEIIPLSIVNIYGTIGLTNYGHLDKEKVGIIKELDNKEGKRVNTFLDDLVAAIAAAAASRIAHSMPN